MEKVEPPKECNSRSKMLQVDISGDFLKLYGCFLKWGYYPEIIHLDWIFHYKPSSYWGTTMTMELPNHGMYWVV